MMVIHPTAVTGKQYLAVMTCSVNQLCPVGYCLSMNYSIRHYPTESAHIHTYIYIGTYKRVQIHGVKMVKIGNTQSIIKYIT